MNDAFRCSRATQLLVETPEAANLTEFCPMLTDERKKAPC